MKISIKKQIKHKNSLIFKLQQAIVKAVKEEFKLKLKPIDILVEHPENEQFGDYSTNIAMQIFTKIKKHTKNIKLHQVAEKICQNLQKQKLYFIDKVEVKANFINISIKYSYLIKQLQRVLKEKDRYGHSDLLSNRKIMVEYAHPNTHKAFHIGHLRNISIGESLVRILEANKAKVVRANYQGDVGMHIAKCLYSILKTPAYDQKMSKLKSLDQKVKFISENYIRGTQAYEENKKAQGEIKDINYLVYAAAQQYQEKINKIKPGSTDYLKFVKAEKKKLTEVYDLWVKTRTWSLEQFGHIYKRLYSHFDRFYFESECLGGIDLAYDALKKGILKKSKGAIVFDGSKYGLDTRVFVNSLGLPTYEGKELSLAKKELTEHGKLDKIIHVVTPEQSSFFKATFKVEEILGWQKNVQYHLAYEWVRLKKGKMSSRLGNIVLGEWLLDEAKKRLSKVFKVDQNTAEIIAVGAVKYSFLKQSIGKDMAFDFDESINLQGNSGPYLQYTYARCISILHKSQITNNKSQIKPNFSISQFLNFTPNREELRILKYINRFSEVVMEAANQYAPNFICTYLYELAQRFNTFYNKFRIIGNSEQETVRFRLSLTAAVAQILKNGLYLLGIRAPEKM